MANLGDSRGILCDSKGTVIPLSFDHKPQQVRAPRLSWSRPGRTGRLVPSFVVQFLCLFFLQLKERKRIQEAGGFISFNGVWRVAGILATSRALGDFPLKVRPITFNITLKKMLLDRRRRLDINLVDIPRRNLVDSNSRLTVDGNLSC